MGSYDIVDVLLTHTTSTQVQFIKHCNPSGLGHLLCSCTFFWLDSEPYTSGEELPTSNDSKAEQKGKLSRSCLYTLLFFPLQTFKKLDCA